MVKVEAAENTEQKILDAAKKVFMQKGSAGARMQDIADEAGINKALLHYYFRSKEKLFEVIFREAIGRLLPGISRIFESEDMDFFGKIRAFCRMYIQMGIDHPYLPIFVLHEMHTGSGGPFKKILSAFKNKPLQAVVLSVNEAIKTKTIRPVDPLQLILNIFSLCIFPVVAKPMFQHVSGLTDDQLDKLLAARVDEVSTFIINAIRYTK